jgi:RNA polymerase sigma-70 factor (ECF subfamily)
LFVQGYDIAEEVTQSVFVTVAGKLSKGEYTEQGRFESWLFRVAMNRIRDEARRTKRQATVTDPETLDAQARGPGAATETAEQREDVAGLRRALEQLSDQDREVVELRHHAGLSFKQMSEMLEEPLGTLLARHHRALKKLKDLITSGPTEPAQASGETP